MKQISLLSLFLCIYAQAQHFLPAVVTLKNEEKITGTIAYNTPMLTPQVFEFKNEAGQTKTLTINDVKEVSITDKAKFISEEFEISRHAENLQKLEENPDYNLKKERHFVEQIAFGRYNLYKYADPMNKAYFYKSSENGSEIKPLLYKEFFVKNGDKGTKKDYLNVLNDINCGDINFQNVRYIENSLTSYFDKINECNGETDKQYEKAKGYYEHKMYALYSKMKDHNETGFGGGYEFEYHLPFNNYSFAIAAAPGFISYTEATDIKYRETTTSAIFSLPILFRYYPVKMKNLKVYASYSVFNFSQVQQTLMIYNSIKQSDNYFTTTDNNFFEVGLRYKTLEAFSRFHSAKGDNAVSFGLKYNIYSTTK